MSLEALLTAVLFFPTLPDWICSFSGLCSTNLLSCSASQRSFSTPVAARQWCLMPTAQRILVGTLAIATTPSSTGLDGTALLWAAFHLNTTVLGLSQEACRKTTLLREHLDVLTGRRHPCYVILGVAFEIFSSDKST